MLDREKREPDTYYIYEKFNNDISEKIINLQKQIKIINQDIENKILSTLKNILTDPLDKHKKERIRAKFDNKIFTQEGLNAAIAAEKNYLEKEDEVIKNAVLCIINIQSMVDEKIKKIQYEIIKTLTDIKEKIWRK